MRLILFQLVRSFTGSMIVDPSYGSPIFPSAVETLLMGGNQIRSLPSRVTDKQGIKVTSMGGANLNKQRESKIFNQPDRHRPSSPNQVVSLFMNELEEIESYGKIEELNVGSNK